MSGFDKASGEFALVCSTHNLKKVAKFLVSNILFIFQCIHTLNFRSTSKEFVKGIIDNLVGCSIKATKISQLKVRDLFTHPISSKFFDSFGKLFSSRKKGCCRTAS